MESNNNNTDRNEWEKKINKGLRLIGKIKNQLRIFQGHFGRILKNRKA